MSCGHRRSSVDLAMTATQMEARMTLTISIADATALLKFLDAAEPTPANPVPPVVVTLADAIEAKIAEATASQP